MASCWSSHQHNCNLCGIWLPGHVQSPLCACFACLASCHYIDWSIFALCLCFYLRSLCVDALIELSDENADWKLSFDEFLNCLKPGFNPPEKSEFKATVWRRPLNATRVAQRSTRDVDAFKWASSVRPSSERRGEALGFLAVTSVCSVIWYR